MNETEILMIAMSFFKKKDINTMIQDISNPAKVAEMGDKRKAEVKPFADALKSVQALVEASRIETKTELMSSETEAALIIKVQAANRALTKDQATALIRAVNCIPYFEALNQANQMAAAGEIPKDQAENIYLVLRCAMEFEYETKGHYDDLVRQNYPCAFIYNGKLAFHAENYHPKLHAAVLAKDPNANPLLDGMKNNCALSRMHLKLAKELKREADLFKHAGWGGLCIEGRLRALTNWDDVTLETIVPDLVEAFKKELKIVNEEESESVLTLENFIMFLQANPVHSIRVFRGKQRDGWRDWDKDGKFEQKVVKDSVEEIVKYLKDTNSALPTEEEVLKAQAERAEEAKKFAENFIHAVVSLCEDSYMAGDTLVDDPWIIAGHPKEEARAHLYSREQVKRLFVQPTLEEIRTDRKEYKDENDRYIAEYKEAEDALVRDHGNNPDLENMQAKLLEELRGKQWRLKDRFPLFDAKDKDAEAPRAKARDNLSNAGRDSVIERKMFEETGVDGKRVMQLLLTIAWNTIMTEPGMLIKSPASRKNCQIILDFFNDLPESYLQDGQQLVKEYSTKKLELSEAEQRVVDRVIHVFPSPLHKLNVQRLVEAVEKAKVKVEAAGKEQKRTAEEQKKAQDIARAAGLLDWNRGRKLQDAKDAEERAKEAAEKKEDADRILRRDTKQAEMAKANSHAEQSKGFNNLIYDGRRACLYDVARSIKQFRQKFRDVVKKEGVDLKIADDRPDLTNEVLREGSAKPVQPPKKPAAGNVAGRGAAGNVAAGNIDRKAVVDKGAENIDDDLMAIAAMEAEEKEKRELQEKARQAQAQIEANQKLIQQLMEEDEAELEAERRVAAQQAQIKALQVQMDRIREEDRKEAEEKRRKEAEQKAKAEADRKVKEEADRKAKEERDRKAAADAAANRVAAQQEADRRAQAQQEQERKAKEERDRKAAADAAANRQAQLEQERKAKEDKERREREEKEKKAKEEAERKNQRDLQEAAQRRMQEGMRMAAEQQQQRAAAEAKAKAEREAKARADQQAAAQRVAAPQQQAVPQAAPQAAAQQVIQQVVAQQNPAQQQAAVLQAAQAAQLAQQQAAAQRAQQAQLLAQQQAALRAALAKGFRK